MVVIEPRDARGRLVDAPADIQVVVLDPERRGPEPRVARWDITAAEAAARLGDPSEPGIHLNLPWPDRPPTHSKLRLFVRYLTSDGRKLEANRFVEVASSRRIARPVGRPPARAPSVSDEAVISTSHLSEGPSSRTASGLSDPGRGVRSGRPSGSNGRLRKIEE